MMNDGPRSGELGLARTLNRLADEEAASLERLFHLLAIPSISTDPAHHESCLAAAEWCAASLREIGFDARVEPTLGKPMVVGHWRAKEKSEARRHVLFYGHYDVQPADPLEEWDAPPFSPRLVEDPRHGKTIVARGASDDWPGDDLHGGLPRLARRAWFAPRRCQRTHRGRGGIGKPEPCPLPRRPWR